MLDVFLSAEVILPGVPVDHLIHEAVTESELDSTVAALCAQLQRGTSQSVQPKDYY